MFLFAASPEVLFLFFWFSNFRFVDDTGPCGKDSDADGAVCVDEAVCVDLCEKRVDNEGGHCSGVQAPPLMTFRSPDDGS